MKKQVFYMHGGEAYSKYEDFLYQLKTCTIHNPLGESAKLWPQNLQEQLGDEYEVFTPRMPNKQNAKYEEWKIWFERYFEFLHDEVILVGWSLGGFFLVKYLIENKLPFKVKELFLISTPFQTDDFKGEDGGDFASETNKIGKIFSKVENITILHSKDDFLVPYEHALQLKESLPDAKLITYEDKNHFSVEELPELIEMIKGLG